MVGESQDVLWPNQLKKMTLVNAELGTPNVDKSRRASISSWSLPGDPDLVNRAKCVTAEMLSQLCHEGYLDEAVEALGVLVQAKTAIPRSLVYSVLKRCVEKNDLVLGRRVHALTLGMGYETDTFLCNHIMRMYASHGRLQDALDVFQAVAHPDAFMWSSIISAHVKQGQDKQAIELYHRMRRSGVKPDGHVFVAALQACARGSDLETGQQLHADVLASGMEPDLFVCNCLVSMYSKCGSLEDAERVFDGLGIKNVVTWNTMIAGYSQLGLGHKALGLYSVMQEEGSTEPNLVTFVSLLQACASVGNPALEMGRQLHAHIRGRGHQADAFVASSLVNMYAKCGSLEDAQRVFDGLVQKEVVTWTALIAGYSQQGNGVEALRLYRDMLAEGVAIPNSVTFMCLLQASASVGNSALEVGKQLHVQIRERGHETDAFVASSLVNMYAKCGSLEDAQRVFDGLVQKDGVTWTALIGGYAQQGRGQEALRLYTLMQEECIVLPNSVTFVCLLQACASVGASALGKGRQLHTRIRNQGHEADPFVGNSLVNMYAKCGSLEDAQRVFDELGQKDVVTWNALIAAYSHQMMCQEALRLYSDMREDSTAVPDSVTFLSVLQACATMGNPALKKGKQLHAEIRAGGHQADVFLANSLVNMYAKCGSLEDAQRVFDDLAHKDVVAWNALIAGYSQQGMGQEALRLYNAMQDEGMCVPDSVTFVCLLQACASVAALHMGRHLHAQLQEHGLKADLCVAGCLINMYGKCGSMSEAQEVFDALPEKDVFTWSALIAGYTSQGDSELVFHLFQRMREDCIRPVGITYVSILTVCSHAGLVSRGREYFDDMSRIDGISPTVEHYTCMVDLLGRAGQLHEALALVRAMPVPPTSAIWHTLLGACCRWSNVELGRDAFEQAVELDKKDDAAYVLMANVYTAAHMWEQAQGMQARRVGIKAWKQPGQSWWTDLEGRVHSFLVGDKNNFKSQSRLKHTSLKMRKQIDVNSSPAGIPDDCTKEEDPRVLRGKLAVSHILSIIPHKKPRVIVKSSQICIQACAGS